MKKYNKQDQILLATWAASCAERVLPFFQETYPKDDLPQKAVEACWRWAHTGVFKMAEIRGASLAAHEAARDAKDHKAASFSARSAGHAVTTAHVPQHAFGAAYYALRAIEADDPTNFEVNVTKEHLWQSQSLSDHLRQAFLDIILIQKDRGKIFIKLHKGEDF
jgi:hypothetical protein